MLSLFVLAAGMVFGAEPVRLHPENPHYFQFRGKPVVLVTSGEHYGAVLNGAFDYVKYLDTLAKDRLNMTRTFAGGYREVPNDFGIARNTLAPEEGQYVGPYASAGAGRVDLTKWNPAYFERLHKFVEEAGKREIVVEMVLFCTYYRDHMWKMSPWHESRNVNGIGKGVTNTEVLSLKDAALTEVQRAFVRKLVRELSPYDNVYFELVNEPYIAGVTAEFQAEMAKVVVEAEAGLGTRHMIAQNIANGHQVIVKPDANVSLFNFHYARPPVAVLENYGLNKAIGLNETGFDGTGDAVYRLQAWDFLVGGGALYNNLDYSFAVGYEDGTWPVAGDQPGGGSVALRKQLGHLRRFVEGFEFWKMRPDAYGGSVAENESVRVLAEAGRQYAVYVHRGRVMSEYQPRYIVNTRERATTVVLALPEGEYEAVWWNPKTGEKMGSERVRHGGSEKVWKTPAFREDLALEVRRK